MKGVDFEAMAESVLWCFVEKRRVVDLVMVDLVSKKLRRCTSLWCRYVPRYLEMGSVRMGDGQPTMGFPNAVIASFLLYYNSVSYSQD